MESEDIVQVKRRNIGDVVKNEGIVPNEILVMVFEHFTYATQAQDLCEIIKIRE
jgi:hypothetical protein